MKTKIVVSCLLVAFAVTSIQAANVDTALLARYVCRSRADDSRVMVPGSCTQYYICQEGKAQLKTCPRFYDAVSQECVNQNPGCVDTFRDVPSCEGPCCGISDGDYAVDPTNAAVYYLCENNCVAEEKICENGLMFDLVKLECSSPSTCSECTTSKPPCVTTTTTCEPTTTPCTTTTTCTTTTCKPATPATTRTIRTTTTRSTTTRTTTTTRRTTTTTTCSTTTTTCSTTTTTCPTTTTTCETTTTTCPTTTTCATTTTTCPTTTTTCPTTTTCSTTITKAPCKQETTTTTCATTTPPCSTTKPPCNESENQPNSIKGLINPSHYVLPSKMSSLEIQNYALHGCANKPDGYLLPSLTKCNAYFICRNSAALPVSCGIKYFNVKTSACDLPSNTGCIQANLV